MLRNRKIIHYLDGYLQESTEKDLERLTPGCLNGPGMFETMRTVNGEPFLLERHCERLTAGLKLIGLENPFSADRWWTIIQKTMDANHLKDARVRMMVWEDNGHTECSVIARPLVLPSEEIYRSGYRLAVVDQRRTNNPLSAVKSTDYTIFLRALEQAQVHLYDEAVLLNERGHVVEASRSNLFWIQDDALVTPSLSAGCLEGITRGVILDLAHRRSIETLEVEAPLEKLLKAPAAFLTNSVIGLMPVAAIEDHLKNPSASILQTLQNDYQILLKS